MNGTPSLREASAGRPLLLLLLLLPAAENSTRASGMGQTAPAGLRRKRREVNIGGATSSLAHLTRSRASRSTGSGWTTGRGHGPDFHGLAAVLLVVMGPGR